MKELLDANVKFKNAIEDVKLKLEIVKLMKTGERVSGQIDRFGAGLTHHFENVTCKVNMNMEKRKEKSYEVMAKQEAKHDSRRPMTVSGRPRYGDDPIYIPTLDFDPDAAREVVYTDKFGRPDLERIHRERSDKFYHHKIETLMQMMKDRTKKRAKSAPAIRPKATPQYNINNLPETILEDKQMTRNDAEFELKKMRASAMAAKTEKVLLYGEEVESPGCRGSGGDGRVQGKGGGGNRRPGSALSRSNSSLVGRGFGSRVSGDNSKTVSRAPSRSESRSSLVGFRSKSAIKTDRKSSTLDRRPSLSRLTNFNKNQDDDSDMNSMSDSDDELQSSINRAPGPLPENLYFNKLGKKLKDFQDLRYPSRSLDPNPDKYSRQKPFPELFDVKLTHSYNRFCKKAARIKTVEQCKMELEEVIAQSQIKDDKEPWETGYVYKKAWNSAQPDSKGLGTRENSIDTAPSNIRIKG